MAAPEWAFNQVSDGLTFSQKVVAQITDTISRGQLQPGDRLPTERQLAVQFGVSRTAIRDAIKLLAGQGILEVRRGAGIFISSGDHVADRFYDLLQVRQGSIGDLFEVRKVIETEAAGWAAQRRDPAQLEQMRSLVSCAKDASDDPLTLFKFDEAFHLAVAEAAQNAVLFHIMQNLLDLLARSRQESLRIPGRAVQSIAEHDLVIEAIERGDATAARRQMWRHLDSVERAVVQHLDVLGRGCRRTK